MAVLSHSGRAVRRQARLESSQVETTGAPRCVPLLPTLVATTGEPE
jgi:hypothetical protein